MHLLQRAGVTAAAVLNNVELLEDPHLATRGYFEDVDHPATGRRRHTGPVLRISETDSGVRRPAPRLGQHSRYVLAEILGMSDTEAGSFFDSGAITDGPVIE